MIAEKIKSCESIYQAKKEIVGCTIPLRLQRIESCEGSECHLLTKLRKKTMLNEKQDDMVFVSSMNFIRNCEISPGLKTILLQ